MKSPLKPPSKIPQVAIANEVFSPGDAEVTQARRAVAASIPRMDGGFLGGNHGKSHRKMEDDYTLTRGTPWYPHGTRKAQKKLQPVVAMDEQPAMENG